MKYSKFGLGLLGFAWLLLLVRLFGSPFSPSVGNSLIYTGVASLVASVILSSVGKSKEQTGFTKTIFIVSIASIILFVVGLILYGNTAAIGW